MNNVTADKGFEDYTKRLYKKYPQRQIKLFQEGVHLLCTQCTYSLDPPMILLINHKIRYDIIHT